MSFTTTDEDEAARWAIRLDGEPLSPDEESALEVWLTEDERRRGALLRAEAALAYLDRGRSLAGQSPSGDSTFDQSSLYDRAYYRPPSYTLTRRAVLIGGSLTAAASVAVIGYKLSRPQPVEIETAIGEVRRVPLEDGSVASVNTGSRLSVIMHPKRRNVRLEDGEAWFQVAHDKARPFVVESGEVRVQAVGTAFSVRRREDGADVLVTEGIVDTWIAGHEAERTRLVAGQKAFVADASPKAEVVQATDSIDRSLAWRTGEVALNGESLDYAVAELNRYNVRKLVVEDPQLGKAPLVGYFRVDQPENFARAVSGLVGARVEVDGDTIRLLSTRA